MTTANAAQMLQVHTATLRRWEQMKLTGKTEYEGFIVPKRDRLTNSRIFTEEDVEAISKWRESFKDS